MCASIPFTTMSGQIDPYDPYAFLNPVEIDQGGCTLQKKEKDPFGLKNPFLNLKAQQRKIGYDVNQIASTLNSPPTCRTQTTSLLQVTRQEEQRFFTQLTPSNQNQTSLQAGPDSRALQLAQMNQAFSDFQMNSSIFTSPFRQHAAHVATAASAARVLDNAVNWAISGAVTGAVKGTHAVCSAHPVLQLGCDHMTEGGSRFLDSITHTADEYWNGSYAQQVTSEQYKKGSRVFNTLLTEQGLSLSEATEYKNNLKAVGSGVVLCASFGGVGLLHKASTVTKATEAVKGAHVTVTTTKAVETAQVLGKTSKAIKGLEVATVTDIAPNTNRTVEALKGLSSKKELISSESLTALSYDAPKELTRTRFLEKQQIARRNYEHAIIQEQALLSRGFSSTPFVPPTNFPTNIHLFYRECTPHSIKGTKLGAQGIGSINNTVLTLTNDDHMLFLVKNKHASHILGERNITIIGTQAKSLSSAERIDFTVKEALRIATESGAKRLSFAWDPAKQPVALTLLNQGHSIIGRGTLSRGLYETPFELVEIFFPKVNKP